MNLTEFPAKATNANCQGHDPELFFPAPLASTGRVTTAKEICQGCPVFDLCLDYSLRHNVQGVWAATTEKERAALRVARGIKAAPLSFGPDRTNSEAIRRMYRSGRSVRHIAERLDISEQAVRQSIRAYEERRAERGEPPITDPSVRVDCPEGCGARLLPGSVHRHRKYHCPATAVAS